MALFSQDESIPVAVDDVSQAAHNGAVARAIPRILSAALNQTEIQALLDSQEAALLAANNTWSGDQDFSNKDLTDIKDLSVNESVVIGVNPSPAAGYSLNSYSTSDSFAYIEKESDNQAGVLIDVRKKRGSAITAATSDYALAINGRVWDGTGYNANPDASIRIAAAAAFTTISHPTKFEFRLCPAGSLTAGLVGLWNSDGSLTLGSSSGTGLYDFFSRKTAQVGETVNTNFKLVRTEGGITCYTSNGTTPVGNLTTGVVTGSKCLNGPSGKSYYYDGAAWQTD
jgi:hypothetical protein